MVGFVRELEIQAEGRMETGIMTPKGDWPGIFIRGDDALIYASKLKFLLDKADSQVDASKVTMFETICWNKMQGLVDLLESCRAPADSNGDRQ